VNALEVAVQAYRGRIVVRSVERDPANANMRYATVVRDERATGAYAPGTRIYFAASQFEPA